MSQPSWLPSHVVSLPLKVPTEADELAAANKICIPSSSPLAQGRMLELRGASGPEPAPPPQAWPGPESAAVAHPGLIGFVMQARGLGCRLAIDTSLRPALGNLRLRGRNAELANHLQSIGGYFSRRRQCVGLALDSAWHELVHEMCHLKFHNQVRLAKPGACRHEPLRLHWEQWKLRGYSELMAEELVCRTHEMHSLRCQPSLRSAFRALLVWDNMNFEAHRELSAIAPGKRSASQSTELRRVALLRATVTGPVPRLGVVLAAGLAATVAIGKVVRQRQPIAPAEGHPR